MAAGRVGERWRPRDRGSSKAAARVGDRVASEADGRRRGRRRGHQRGQQADRESEAEPGRGLRRAHGHGRTHGGSPDLDPADEFVGIRGVMEMRHRDDDEDGHRPEPAGRPPLGRPGKNRPSRVPVAGGWSTSPARSRARSRTSRGRGAILVGLALEDHALRLVASLAALAKLAWGPGLQIGQLPQLGDGRHEGLEGSLRIGEEEPPDRRIHGRGLPDRLHGRRGTVQGQDSLSSVGGSSSLLASGRSTRRQAGHRRESPLTSGSPSAGEEGRLLGPIGPGRSPLSTLQEALSALARPRLPVRGRGDPLAHGAGALSRRPATLVEVKDRDPRGEGEGRPTLGDRRDHPGQPRSISPRPTCNRIREMPSPAAAAPA